MQAAKMANEILKQVFQDMHSDIATSVNPETIMEVLLSKKVLGANDVKKLRQIPVSRDRCRDMMSLLFISKHPQAFIRLRLGYLPLPQIFPPIDSLPASGLTPRTSRLDRFF